MHLSTDFLPADEYRDALRTSKRRRSRQMKPSFLEEKLYADSSKNERKFGKLAEREIRLSNKMMSEFNLGAGSIRNMLVTNHARMRQLAGLTWGRTKEERLRMKEITARVEAISDDIENLIHLLITLVREQDLHETVMTHAETGFMEPYQEEMDSTHTPGTVQVLFSDDRGKTARSVTPPNSAQSGWN